MRIRNIPVWLCGAILCLAGQTAFCQSLGSSLATGTSLSSNSGGGGGLGEMTEASRNAAVSAGYSANVNALVQAEVSGQAGSGSGASGHGAGATNAGLGAVLSGTSRHPLPGNRRSGPGWTARIQARQPIAGSLRDALRRSGLTAARAKRGPRAAGVSKPAAARSVSGANAIGSSAASYTMDFPDSTKGTAQISPPDPDTSSPLDWSPGLNFAISDFTNQKFLNPTLSGGGSRGRGVARRQAAARRRASSSTVLNSLDSSLPLDDMLKTDSLQPNLLNSSGPTSILDQP